MSVEGAQPVQVLGIPRVAILSDQQGSYVYVVDADKKAQIHRVTLGQSSRHHRGDRWPASPRATAVITEGLQRVRPGCAVVNPAPAGAPPPPPGSVPPSGAEGLMAMISDVFIGRPRLAVVIAIITTIAGGISLTRIPVSQFPEIVPPQVQVTTRYPRCLRRGGGGDGGAAAWRRRSTAPTRCST